MPAKDKPANYVKLTAFGPPALHDSDAISIAPDPRKQECAVSWVYPFSGTVEGKLALVAAQRKREELTSGFPNLPEGSFQLSTFKPSPLRGVPVQGVSVRQYLGAEAAE